MTNTDFLPFLTILEYLIMHGQIGWSMETGENLKEEPEVLLHHKPADIHVPRKQRKKEN